MAVNAEKIKVVCEFIRSIVFGKINIFQARHCEERSNLSSMVANLLIVRDCHIPSRIPRDGTRNDGSNSLL